MNCSPKTFTGSWCFCNAWLPSCCHRRETLLRVLALDNLCGSWATASPKNPWRESKGGLSDRDHRPRPARAHRYVNQTKAQQYQHQVQEPADIGNVDDDPDDRQG